MRTKVGLVGCGNWGKLILRDLVACGADVAVVCRGEQSLRNAREHGASTVHEHLHELPTVDGYVVATPSTTHAEVIEQLLGANKPVFVEKPLTTDVASARRVVATAGERLAVMDKWRYHPALEAMQREILEGRVGDVLSIRLERWGWGNPHRDTSGLWILAPHDCSIVEHLVGSLPPLRSVVAVRRERPELGLTAHLGGDEGPSVTFSLGIVSPSHRRHCLVVGTSATLELRGGYETTVYVRDGTPGSDDARERTIEVSDAMPLRREIEAFLAWLRGGPTPLSPAADALATVERIAQIEAALQEGGEP